EDLAGGDREADLVDHVVPVPAHADLEVGDLDARGNDGVHQRPAWDITLAIAGSSVSSSTPMTTRATASVNVLVPTVRMAISAAAVTTAQGLMASPSR